MKKVVLMIISILCVMTTAYANEDCNLNLSADIDNPCKVLVNVENAEHIYGGSFVLEYNNTIIELIECTVGFPLENTTAIINKSYADNKIKLTWASANPITYNKPILNIEFKVIDETATQSEISFGEVTLYDIDSNEVFYKTNNILLKISNKDTYTSSTPEENVTSRSTGRDSVSKYTVNFETNGGNKIKTVDVEKNKILQLIETPIKEGYVFDGWYTDEGLSKAYDFNTKVTKSITLYAKWSEIDSTLNQIILTIGDMKAQVYGEVKYNDVAPKIVNDRTMLPARFVAENLGATVTWTEAEPTKVLITKDDIEIIIYINSDKAYVNDKEIILDSPAFIENDRTYTPVRFICENLGANVTWDNDGKIVTITKGELN